jgi:four helix bundle protein
MNRESNPIVELTFGFSLEIIEYTELLHVKKKYNMASQLFRSGTSIGANVREAQNCESRNDFIHKMKMAAKEAEETKYWLFLCKDSKWYPDPVLLIDKIQVIIKILNKIITTSKKTVV